MPTLRLHVSEARLHRGKVRCNIADCYAGWGYDKTNGEDVSRGLYTTVILLPKDSSTQSPPCHSERSEESRPTAPKPPLSYTNRVSQGKGNIPVEDEILRCAQYRAKEGMAVWDMGDQAGPCHFERSEKSRSSAHSFTFPPGPTHPTRQSCAGWRDGRKG